MNAAISSKPASAEGAASAPARARALQVGGFTPFSSLDYPGQLAAVVFVQGCPWRCGYCHNPHLQPRSGMPGRAPGEAGMLWSDLLGWLPQRQGLLDAVVFSGGEPTLDPGLPTAMAQVRALGFKVGLHTAGIYPQPLQDVLPLLDWVGLDLKAPLADDAAHDHVTGVPGSAAPVRRSLAAVLQAHRLRGLAFECRTTAHPALLDDDALCRIADELAAAFADAGVPTDADPMMARWVLQICRSQGSRGQLPAVAADYPTSATRRHLQFRWPSFTVRHG